MAIAVVGLVVVLIFGIIGSGLAQKSTLLNVIQVYRHGERTPASFYENDPYQDISYWGLTTGQLTNKYRVAQNVGPMHRTYIGPIWFVYWSIICATRVGKRQHYELGQYTRRRYNGFLPQRYDRADFFVQSTNLDRTHMSAASQLAGLFPPQRDQVWHRGINWQPIPIFPSETAVMSTMGSCTKYWTEYAKVIVSDEYFVKLNEKYAELYEYLTENSGTNVTSLSGVFSIYDALYIEDRQGFILPEWTKSVYPEPLKSLYNICFDAYSFTDELKLLVTGPFFTALINQFDEYLEDPSSAKKYVQFSSHDLNIAAILNTLGAWDGLAPNFASTLYIEFRERNGSNFINIFYKNYGDAEPITIPGCGVDCDWDQFKTLISNRTLTSAEWYELCDS